MNWYFNHYIIKIQSTRITFILSFYVFFSYLIMILVWTVELWLSFWSEVHYNSLYATGGNDVPYKFEMDFCSFYPYLLFIPSELISHNKLIFLFVQWIYRCSS